MAFSKTLLAFLVLGALSLKLYLALTTIGTNDVSYWQHFLEHYLNNGVAGVYRDIHFFNHPPFMLLVLKGLSLLEPYAPNGFPFLIRLPAILADIGTVLIVYKLMRFYKSKQHALIAAALCAVSPVLVLVSGFHGNTDPVFLFFLLCAAERWVIGQSPMIAGLLLGAAINIKIVPLITAAFFIYSMSNWRERSKFIAGVGIIFVLGFGYYLFTIFPLIIKNVFLYSPMPGSWGPIKGLLQQYPQVRVFIVPLVFSLAILLSKSLGGECREQTVNLQHKAAAATFMEGLGLIFLLSLVLAPGIGVQYLSWFVPFVPFLSLSFALSFNIIAGTFIFLVYNFWSNAWPWKYADSDLMGSFIDHDYNFSMFVWILMASRLAFEMWRRFCRSS